MRSEAAKCVLLCANCHAETESGCYNEPMGSRQTEVAWAAGIFEGEGSFSTHTVYGKAYPRASVEMNDEDIVRRYHEIVGVGTLLQRKRPDLRYISVVQDIAGFRTLVDLLEPWLGIRRRAKAQQIIEALGERQGCATMVASRRKKNGHV